MIVLSRGLSLILRLEPYSNFSISNFTSLFYIMFISSIETLVKSIARSTWRNVITFSQHLSLLVRHHDPDFYKYLKSLGADNMFFCYRWLLLEMKREFSFDNAITVLEVRLRPLLPGNGNGPITNARAKNKNNNNCWRSRSPLLTSALLVVALLTPVFFSLRHFIWPYRSSIKTCRNSMH